MYETWKSDAQRSHQERDDDHVRERERVERVGERQIDPISAARPRSVAIMMCRFRSRWSAQAPAWSDEEEVRHELGGDEVSHLGGAGVERQHGDERQRDQADLVAEQRDCLAEPEAAELRVLAQEGRHHHGGDSNLARCGP